MDATSALAVLTGTALMGAAWAATDHGNDYTTSAVTAIIGAIVTITTGLFAYLRVRDERKFVSVEQQLTNDRGRIAGLEEKYEMCEQEKLEMRVRIAKLETAAEEVKRLRDARVAQTEARRRRRDNPAPPNVHPA